MEIAALVLCVIALASLSNTIWWARLLKKETLSLRAYTKRFREENGLD